MGVAGWRFAQKLDQIATKIDELGKKKNLLKSVNCPVAFLLIPGTNSALTSIQKAEFGL